MANKYLSLCLDRENLRPDGGGFSDRRFVRWRREFRPLSGRTRELNDHLEIFDFLMLA